MTTIQYLLCCLMEECDELSQRASKAMRFGVAESQPGQPKNNTERISEEYCDLLAVVALLREHGVSIELSSDAVQTKKAKVKKYMKYSRECGQLT